MNEVFEMAPSDTLSRPRRRRILRRGWIGLWALLVVSQVVLLANHAALDSLAWRTTRWFCGDDGNYQWAQYKASHAGGTGGAGEANAPFYERVNPPLTRTVNGVLEAQFYKRTEKFWRMFRDLGEPYLTVILIVAVSLYDRRRWKAGAMLLAATAVSGGVGELVRVIGGRYRPDAVDGANVWKLWRGFHDGTNLSWPSGHATLAFATAAVLVYLSPRGRWLFLVLAAGCAVARVVMMAHFWGDVIFGGVLGWSVGWFVAAGMDRWMGRKGELHRTL